MKNTVKKLTASIMAVAAFTMGAVGFNASAADVTTPEVPEIIDEYQGPETDISFGSGAHAYAYAESTYIYLKTTGPSNVTVKLDVATYVTLGTGLGLTYASSNGSITHTYYGTGITYAHGVHTSGTDSTNTNRYVG